MAPRIAHPIVENLKVDEVRHFLRVNDFDAGSFADYISNKFNSTYHTSFTNPSDFRPIDCKLLAESFKQKIDEKALKQIIYLFVHHHLMIIQHKLFPEGELKVMRAKISFYSGVSLEQLN